MKASRNNSASTSTHSATFESLESRRLMSAGSDPGAFVGPLEHVVAVSVDSSGTLRITGTDRDDRVTVRRKGSVLTVISESAGGAESVLSLDYRQIRRIVANLGDGNDVFAAKGLITKRISINGDAGNDNLLGGLGSDRIDGGAGDDVIVGAAGIDELIGGSGRDFIDALRGESLGFSSPPSSTRDVIHARDGEVDRIIDGASEEVGADQQDVRTEQPVVQLPPGFNPFGR